MQSRCAAAYLSGGQADISCMTDGTCPTKWSPTHDDISVIDSEDGRLEAIQRRANAAARRRPDDVELLIVAETPPLALDRYFHFEDVAAHDGLIPLCGQGSARANAVASGQEGCARCASRPWSVPRGPQTGSI